MTPTDPNVLLRQLEPAVRPDYAGGSGARPTPPIEGSGFEALLRKASAGQIGSGRQIDQPSVGEPLETEQLGRLGAAADLAEAAGASRALMLVDGRALVLDVPQRQIVGELSGNERVQEIDTAIFVPGEDDQAARPLSLPGGIPPRAVGDQIARAS